MTRPPAANTRLAIALHDGGLAYRPGERVSGHAIVGRQTDARSLRVELRRVERVLHCFRSVLDVAASVVLHDGGKLAAGAAFPFVLELPRDADPPLRAHDVATGATVGTVAWEVTAWADRFGPDDVAIVEIEVVPR